MNTAIFQKPTMQEEVEIKTKIDEALAELKRLRTYAVGPKMMVGFCKYTRIASRIRFALAA